MHACQLWPLPMSWLLLGLGGVLTGKHSQGSSSHLACLSYTEPVECSPPRHFKSPRSSSSEPMHARLQPQARPRGASVMQPLGRLAGRAAGESAAAAAAAEPGSAAFAALAAAEVKPDAVFFHKYYAGREARKPARPLVAAAGSEEASDASDAEIGALRTDASRPRCKHVLPPVAQRPDLCRSGAAVHINSHFAPAAEG